MSLVGFEPGTPGLQRRSSKLATKGTIPLVSYLELWVVTISRATPLHSSQLFLTGLRSGHHPILSGVALLTPDLPVEGFLPGWLTTVRYPACVTVTKYLKFFGRPAFVFLTDSIPHQGPARSWAVQPPFLPSFMECGLL